MTQRTAWWHSALGGSLIAVAAFVTALATPPAGAQDRSVEKEIDSLQQELEVEEERSKEEAEAGDTGGDASERPADGAGDESERSAHRGDSAETTDSEQGRGAERATGFFANWQLYRDPLLCGFIGGAILGLLGVYVVSRRIVFVSAALSQVSALGITVGFFVVAFAGVSGALAEWIPPLVAVFLSFVIVFALVRAGEQPSLPQDAVLGISFVVPMALVFVIGPYVPQEMHEIQSILHGSAVVVRSSDLWAIGLVGAAVLTTQIVAFRGFVFASLDPKVAEVQGLPVRALDGVLLGSIAVMTGLATRALGALPTFALTVLPAIGALRLKVGLRRVFAVAAVLGGCSGAVGYWMAYQLGWSVGASQTIVAAAGMIVVRGVGPLFD
jgi:zinc transport system permease protein